MAVFSRYDLEKNIVTVYFSPGASALAKMFGAAPCEKPKKEGRLSLLVGDLLSIRVGNRSLTRYVAFEGSAAADRVGLKESDGTLFVFSADRMLQALSISSATAGADCYASKFHFVGKETQKGLVINGRKSLVGVEIFLEVACIYSGPAGSITIPFAEDVLDVDHAITHEGNVRVDDITRQVVGHLSLTAVNEPPMTGIYEPVEGGQTGMLRGSRIG